MKIEIIDGFNEVQQRVIKDKNNVDKTLFSQRAYFHGASAFPTEFTISLPNSNGYAVGEYQLHPDSFKVNQYGNLELSRYELKLTPVTPKQLKSA